MRNQICKQKYIWKRMKFVNSSLLYKFSLSIFLLPHFFYHIFNIIFLLSFDFNIFLLALNFYYHIFIIIIFL